MSGSEDKKKPEWITVVAVGMAVAVMLSVVAIKSLDYAAERFASQPDRAEVVYYDDVIFCYDEIGQYVRCYDRSSCTEDEYRQSVSRACMETCQYDPDDRETVPKECWP